MKQLNSKANYSKDKLPSFLLFSKNQTHFQEELRSGLEKALQAWKKLGVTKINHRKLQEALMHKSFVFENKSMLLNLKEYSSLDYERLEFLGDSLLGAITSSFLFDHYHLLDEGKLSLLKHHWVSDKVFSIFYTTYFDDELIMLGKSLLRQDSSNLNLATLRANVFEAMWGAISFELSFEMQQDLWRESFYPLINKKFGQLEQERKDSNFQAKLQEYTLNNYGSAPRINSNFIQERNLFQIEVEINGRTWHIEGTSKKESLERISQEILDEIYI